MSNSTTTINSTPPDAISLVGGNSTLRALIWSATIGAGFAYGLGFVGNLLSLLVFYSQEEFRKISTGLLFILITAANVVHLLSLLTEFLTFYSVSVFRDMFLQCRVTYFAQNLSRAISTYCMVTVALDRLIRTEWPVRARSICTRQNTLIIAGIYLAVFSVVWSFYFYPMSSIRASPGACSFSSTPSLTYFISTIHVPLRALLMCVIPLVIMVLANVRMLMNIRHSRSRVTNGTTMASSEANRPLPTVSSATDKKAGRTSALDRMLFNMMIANVFTFVVSQIPFHAFLCMRPYLRSLDSSMGSAIRAILLIWSSLYFGVAFYFYCLGSPLFRQKFVKIFKKVIHCRAPRRLQFSMSRITH